MPLKSSETSERTDTGTKIHFIYIKNEQTKQNKTKKIINLLAWSRILQQHELKPSTVCY